MASSGKGNMTVRLALAALVSCVPLLSGCDDLFDDFSSTDSTSTSPESPGAVEYKQGRPSIYESERFKRVVVLPFTNGAEYTDTLTEALVHHSRWQVYDRANLAKILREQDLQRMTEFDQATAVRLGKLAGVHFVIFGEYHGSRVVLKAVDVETAEVLVYRNVNASSSDVSVVFAHSIRYLLPYCYKYVNGTLSKWWWGPTADKVAPQELEKGVSVEQ